MDDRFCEKLPENCFPVSYAEDIEYDAMISSKLSDREKLLKIAEIVLDYDGHRTAFGLAKLLDEIFAIAISHNYEE